MIESLTRLQGVGLGLVLILGVSCTHKAPLVKKEVQDQTVPLIHYDYSEGQVKSLCTQAMATATTKLNAVAKLKTKKRTLALFAFEEILANLNDSAGPLTFMNYVSTDPKTHAEGADCEDRLSQYQVGIFTRRDLYNTLRKSKPRTNEEKRLLKETLKQFELNGLMLSDVKLEQVKKLKMQLASKEAAFSTNNNNDESTVEFTDDELSGVSPDFKTRLKRAASGKWVVTTKSTDSTQVMENAILGETRRRMQFAYWNRAADANTKLLQEAILLRREIAELMGYATWADYRTHGRMAKDAKTVSDFLNSLKGKLALRERRDLAELAAFKSTLHSDPTASVDLKSWDIAYLSYQLKKKKFNLDDEVIRPYFPSDVVIQGMFEVYSHLLGVKFVQVKDVDVWADGVTFYEIHDSGNGRLIGYFYADFFPRPGKYGHAAAFPLIGGRKLPNGAYAKPISAIVANLEPPANGKPSLLNHTEVETIFHEFGHVMHQTLTRVPYQSLAGSNVAQDFVEAPSQMLENWVWNPEILKSLSGHYLDHTQKLPDAILKQMIEGRDFQQGYFYTRQLMFALLDMDYHTSKQALDVTSEHDRLYKQMVGIDAPAQTHFPASFGHLMGGYDAGYYGYLWSEVYAQDMFSHFEEAKGGLVDAKVGAEYRKDILERGDMQEAMSLLQNFMGRQPNSKAFLKKLHIQ